MELLNTRKLIKERCISVAQLAGKHSINKGTFYRVLSGDFHPTRRPAGTYWQMIEVLKKEDLLRDIVVPPPALVKVAVEIRETA